MAFKIESSLLDACALAILARGDTYGYEITRQMKAAIEISESTLYPVLRRLKKDGLCVTYDQPYQGRNRRYYRITERGMQRLADYLSQWRDYRQNIERLLYEQAGENEPAAASQHQTNEENHPAMEESIANPGERGMK